MDKEVWDGEDQVYTTVAEVEFHKEAKCGQSQFFHVSASKKEKKNGDGLL